MLCRIFKEKNDGSTINEYSAIIIGSLISFATGAHLGWTSPFLPIIQSDEYPFQITNEIASYIAIVAPLGDIFGEIFSTLIVDKIGRKNTLLICSVPILMSNVLIYFSNISYYFIFVARFLGGITMGTTSCIITMYTGEISRPSIRGKLGVIVPVTFISGIISVNAIGKFVNVYETSLILGLVVIIYMSIFSFMPDTPYYFLMKNKLDEARKSLSFFRRNVNCDKEFLKLSEDVKRQLSERGTYKDLFVIKSNRKALVLMMFGRIFQQLTGATAFLMYTQNLLSISNDIFDAHTAVIVIYFMQLLTALLSGFYSDKFGRIPLMTFSSFTCSLVLFLFGSYFVLKDYVYFDFFPYVPVVLLTTFYVCFQIGVGSLIGVILGEIFSASIKPKALCIANVTYSIVVILTTKFYQICSDYIHISVCMYLFALCTLLSAFFFKRYYPETKGKTLEEIQMDLKGITIRRRSENNVHL